MLYAERYRIECFFNRLKHYRAVHERWKVQHLRDRTTREKLVDRQKRQTHMPGKQREVMHHYEQVMKMLARSDRGDDRQLAEDLIRYLGHEAACRTQRGHGTKILNGEMVLSACVLMTARSSDYLPTGGHLMK